MTKMYEHLDSKNDFWIFPEKHSQKKALWIKSGKEKNWDTNGILKFRSNHSFFQRTPENLEVKIENPIVPMTFPSL